MQVPAADANLASSGYTRYHCYAASQIQLFEAYLALDAAHAIESCATVWASMLYTHHNQILHISLQS